ncbi:MAG: tail fiber domain-containing protein, partial [Bacteroidota bacterium]
MMKTNNLLLVVALFSVLLFGVGAVEAQTVGTPNGNTAFFNTNSTGKLLGHRETGSFGLFGSGNQWIGIGQPTVSPFSTTKVPAYGLRSQWQGQAGIFSLKSASGSVKDLVVEWGSNLNSKLKFNFISNLSNPSALKEVMTMTSSGLVGIGTSSPFATLDVNTTAATGGSTSYGFQSRISNSNFAVYAGNFNLSIPNSYAAYGVNASATSGSSFVVYGGYFRASNSSSGSSNAYGVYATTGGTAANKWAGYFVGDVYISGALTVASDKKFKKNIKSLSSKSVTAQLMELNPSTYLYKNTEELQFTKGTQYGFLAQEVEAVFPDLVRDVEQPVYDGLDEAGNPKIVEGESLKFKSINYIGLIPVLT